MDVEQGLIGGLLNHPHKLAEVYEIIRPDDFRAVKCGIVYGALVEITKGGGTPDLISAAKHLHGQIDMGWLSSLTTGASFPSNLARDAKTIADDARAANIRKRALALSKSALDADSLASELLALAGESIGRESKSWKMADVVSRFRRTVQDNKGADYGIPTGYKFLDAKYIRYMPGHVWMIGAKTSAGKTACVVDMICRLFELGDYRAAIVSTEMMEEQNTARMLARMTGFHSNLILSGKLRDGWGEVDDRLKWLAEKDISLFDDIYSFQDIEMRLRQITMGGKIDVVFIDYVQNMTWAGSGTEYEKTNNIAKGLQRLAKQLKTCIVCLSQVSNNTAQGNHDNLEFKGGGELAAVADLGVMLRRYKKTQGQPANLLAFAIEKNRHGACGHQTLEFINNFTRLEEVNHADNA